jgi:N-acetylglucosaminyldiphosphoundecaprenol N-acetyl-beta-D-mannosaminyltransferase
MPKVDILGVRVDVKNREDLERAILDGAKARAKQVVAYVNVNAVNSARRDERLREFLNTCEIVYCDGEGVRLGARLLGTRLPPRVVLTYWIWQLCALCEKDGITIFLLGGREGTAAKAVLNLKKRFPGLRIAGSHHGYFSRRGKENEAVLDMIRIAKPDLLFVGFGVPLQEYWISENYKRIDATVILPSGSMIEYTAGEKGIAPLWMSGHGLEWMFRLCQEPGRLWRRYLFGNPMFLGAVLMQRFKKGTGS